MSRINLAGIIIAICFMSCEKDVINIDTDEIVSDEVCFRISKCNEWTGHITTKSTDYKISGHTDKTFKLDRKKLVGITTCSIERGRTAVGDLEIDAYRIINYKDILQADTINLVQSNNQYDCTDNTYCLSINMN